MGWFDLAAGGLRILAFCVIVAATVILYRSHRRARATIFADLLLKATLLFMALLYLSFVGDSATSLPGDPALYSAAAAAGYVMVAAFLFATAWSLWTYTKRTSGAVIVSPDFLAGLRTRTAAMYGDGPSRFIVYAVGKESAEEGMRRFLSHGHADAEGLWNKIPSWFRMMGYGRMRVVEKNVGSEVRVTIEDTIESLHPDKHKGGCDMTRGYLAGVGSALHDDKECECVEARCARLHGGGACEFTLHWFPAVSAAPRVSQALEA